LGDPDFFCVVAWGQIVQHFEVNSFQGCFYFPVFLILPLALPFVSCNHLFTVSFSSELILLSIFRQNYNVEKVDQFDINEMCVYLK
jgi:hypothetical protein